MSRAFVVVAVAVCVGACSSKKPVDKAAAPQPHVKAEYVSGIAAAYYCTCDRWPDSWNELRRFDDYLHDSAQQAGEVPLKRFAWSAITASVTVQTDRSLLIRPKQVAGENPKAGEQLESIGVPAPDCSRFDRARFARGCNRPPHS